MTLPAGAREVDPVAEARRLARDREPAAWPVAADCMVRVPDPSADHGSVLVHVTIAAQEPLRFVPDTGERLTGVLAGCLDHGDGDDAAE